MLHLASFKKIGCYWQWRKVISLAVLITFSSSVVSPVFADPTIPQDSGSDASLYEEESTCYGDECFHGMLGEEIPVISEEPADVQDQEASVVSEDEECLPKESLDSQEVDALTKESVGFLTEYMEEGQNFVLLFINVTGNVANTVSEYAGEGLDNALVSMADKDWLTKENAEFLSEYTKEYLSAASRFALLEAARKTSGRMGRSSLFQDPLVKSSFPTIESTSFIRRNLAAPVNNILPMVKKSNAEGDPIESGKAIRTSLVAHAIVLPFQIGLGWIAASGFNLLGVNQAISDNVGTYAKWSGWASTTHEFSGKTGELVTSVEYPGLQAIPPVLNVILLFGCHMLIPGGTADAAAMIKHFAISETVASVLTTAILGAGIYNSEAYDKYQLFNVSDGVVDGDLLNEMVWEYGMPAFKTQASTTVAGIMDLSMLGGIDGLGTRKDMDMIGFAVNPVSTAGARASGRMVMESVAKSEDPEKTWNKIYLGLATNAVLVLPYVFLLINPNAVAKNPVVKDMSDLALLFTTDEEWSQMSAKTSLVMTMAAVRLVQGVERSAKEMLYAFGEKDQSWFKSVGDAANVIVPVAGVVYFKRYGGNVQNYRIAQVLVVLFSTVPTLISIVKVNI